MKTKYILLAMAAMAATFTACDDEFVNPPVYIPQATLQPNTSIYELKADYWKSDRNYVSVVGSNPTTGEHIIVKGRVVTTDATGNVFKNIVIQDEGDAARGIPGAALTIAINAYDLYQTYRYGQEVVVDVTGLKIGGYNGLMQLGDEGSYNGQPSMTFMTKELFDEHAEPDGLWDAAKCVPYTTTIAEANAAKANQTDLMMWQSRMIKIENVKFEDAGKMFAPDATTNRYVVDENGNRLNVRCSSYADWARDVIPGGYGTLTGVLSYYGTDWQVIINSPEMSLSGFEAVEPSPEPTPNPNPGPDPNPAQEGDGTEASPFSCAQVIAMNPSSTSEAVKSGVWVKGYIVGWADMSSTYYINAETQRFTAPATMATNILVADGPDVKDYTKCIGVQLPSGAVRSALNLVDNPGNLGKEVALKGDIMKYSGVPGLKNTSAYTIEGVEPTPDPEPGETAQFKLVDKITSGKQYIIVADGHMAQPLNKDYGYLQATDVTATDGVINTSADNAFIIETVNGGYSIKAADKYYYMTGTYNSFNVQATMPADGGVWTITFDQGAAVITNVAMKKSLQYDTQYKSYGAYPDVRGTYPSLYEKVD